jgi:hypothetical protein
MAGGKEKSVEPVAPRFWNFLSACYLWRNIPNAAHRHKAVVVVVKGKSPMQVRRAAPPRALPRIQRSIKLWLHIWPLMRSLLLDWRR